MTTLFLKSTWLHTKAHPQLIMYRIDIPHTMRIALTGNITPRNTKMPRRSSRFM